MHSIIMPEVSFFHFQLKRYLAGRILISGINKNKKIKNGTWFAGVLLGSDLIH